MSQDEALRMAATVVDNFSGPLKSLRKQMQDLSREGGVHNETLAKGFKGVEGAAVSAEKAISSGLKPALAVVGITGLSATAAITGIAAAMRNFAAGAASLGALSRETGQTADTLRTFGAVASKFGVDQDAVASGTKNFAAQMREFGRGIGDTYQWLNRQGRDAAGRKHFQDFAADLRATTDRGEQLRKVLREMENISDPVERGMFAEKFFGNADLGRLGDKHFGPILEMWKKTAQKLGPLDPAAVKSAEDFERTMSELRTSMQKLGVTIGQEVLPYASQFTTWLSDVVGGQRNDVVAALRKGLKDIRSELDGINWAQAGKDAKEFLVGTATFASDTVKALKAVATLLSALKDLKDGNLGEALKKLGEADRATDLGMGQGRAPGTIQDQFKADTGPLLQRQQEMQNRLRILDESIARKESGYDASGENRVVDAEGRAKRERLIEETRKLADEIRRLREDPAKKPAAEATAQPSAFETGTGMGNLIHRASLGGLAGAAQVGRALGSSGGIVVPGDGGGAGDRLFGGAPGGIEIGGGITGRPFGAPAAGSGADRVGRALRGKGGSKSGPEGIPYEATDLKTALGINDKQWSAYREGLTDIEGKRYDQVGGAGGRYSGRYQFGPREIAETARQLGEAPPSRAQFLGDKAMQERFMERYTLEHHKYLESNSAAYRAMSAEKKLEILGYAHNQGAGRGSGRVVGALGYLESGRAGRDGFGTSGTAYFGTIRRRLAEAKEWRSASERVGEQLRGLGGGADGAPEASDGKGVNADLIRTLKRAQELSEVPFHIHEGLRSAERQKDMVRRGWSKTLNSEHLKGRAVDVRADGDPAVGDLKRERYAKIADAMRRASRETGVPVEWGGDWKSFKDVPHFQLPKGYASDAGPYVGDMGASQLRERQAQEEARRKGLQLNPAARDALRKGAGGGAAGVDGANGQIDVRVHNPGPNTRVGVEANGPPFREVHHNRGRQMQPAGTDI